jgi:hypothetical protein
MSQMRVVAFPACRSESENDEKEFFRQAAGAAQEKKLLERRAETNGDAS